jgi:ABC-type lipoprotein release transport system permease subunit
MRLVVDNPLEVRALLEAQPHVTASTFRANAFALVSSQERTYGVAVIGIEPEKEARVSTIKQLIREGSYLESEKLDGAIIGDLLARNLRAEVGDELTLLGQGRDGSVAATVLTVTGIYKSGQDEFDRSSMQINLSNFQEVFFMRGSVHEVVALCDSLENVYPTKKATIDRLGETDPGRSLVVLDWDELMPGLLEGIEMDLVSGLIFYFLLILVVAFSILNTFLMSVLERKREFGVLLSLGVTPWRLSKLLMIESTALTLIGVVAGLVLGAAVTLFFQQYGISMGSADELMAQFGMPNRLFPKLSFMSATIGPALVLGITFLTALYPALRVHRFTPVTALKR